MINFVLRLAEIMRGVQSLSIILIYKKIKLNAEPYGFSQKEHVVKTN